LYPTLLAVDTQTEQLWRNEATPFDGLTLWTPPLPTARLRAALAAIVAILEGYVDSPRLRTTEDWHEHDGYMSDADDASWGQLLAALSSDRALLESCPEDELVRRAWRAEDNSFYLRWSRQEDAPSGDADFTSSRQIVDTVARRLAELGVVVEIGPAGEFFTDRYGG